MKLESIFTAKAQRRNSALASLRLCVFALIPWLALSASGAQLINEGKLQSALNANGKAITNASLVAATNFIGAFTGNAANLTNLPAVNGLTNGYLQGSTSLYDDGITQWSLERIGKALVFGESSAGVNLEIDPAGDVTWPGGMVAEGFRANGGSFFGNGHGLTNLSAGSITNAPWATNGGAFSGDGSGLTNVIVRGDLTNVVNLIFKDSAGNTLAVLRGGGAQTNDVRHTQGGSGGNMTFQPAVREYVGQTWTASSSFSLTKVTGQFYRDSSGVTGTLEARIYSGTSTNVPLTLLATSAAINLSSVSVGTPTVIDFAFGTPLAITNGALYCVVFHTPTLSGTYLRAVCSASGGADKLTVSANGTVWDPTTYANLLLYFQAATINTVAVPGQMSLFGDAAQALGATNLVFGPHYSSNGVLQVTPGAPPAFTFADGTNGLANIVFGSATGNGSGLTNLSASQLLTGTVPIGRLTTNTPATAGGQLMQVAGTDRYWTSNVWVSGTMTNGGGIVASNDVTIYGGSGIDLIMTGGIISGPTAITNNVIKVQGGGANTLVVTNNQVGIGRVPTSTYALDVNGLIYAVSGARLANLNAGTLGNSILAGSVGDAGNNIARIDLQNASTDAFMLIARTNSYNTNCMIFTASTATNNNNLFAFLSNAIPIISVPANGVLAVSNGIITASGGITNLSSHANLCAATEYATNFVLTAPKWDDIPFLFNFNNSGATAPNNTSIGNGLFGLGFPNSGFTKYVMGTAQLTHKVAQTNNAANGLFNATNLYSELHLHISPDTQNTPIGGANGSNACFQVIWTASPIGTNRYPSETTAVTNMAQLTFGTNAFNLLLEFGHTTFATFYPGISTVWQMRAQRVAVTNGTEYVGDVILKAADLHYPVQFVGGSGADNTP